MKPIKLTEECIHCLAEKFTRQYPEDTDEKTKLEYIKRTLRAISDASLDMSAPEIVENINIIQEEMFGKSTDYTEIKRYFNKLMLSKEDDIQSRIKDEDDPIKTAIKYSMMGNYIDFGTIENVEADKLFKLLDNAKDIQLDDEEYEKFTYELKNAKKIVFLTDNCGEIVLDKLLIKAIKEEYPKLQVDVIVRGYPVLNDATLDDAYEVGMEKIADVLDNGSRVAGTCVNKISKDALEKIENADLIIAKGQGNFETMRYCTLNVYYIFMCKCDMFAEKFNVPKFSGMFLNDLRL